MPPRKKIVRYRGVTNRTYDKVKAEVARYRKKSYDLKRKIDEKPIESTALNSLGGALAGFVSMQNFGAIGPVPTSAALGLGLIGYGGWLAKSSDPFRKYAIHLGSGMLAANAYQFTRNMISENRG